LHARADREAGQGSGRGTLGAATSGADLRWPIPQAPPVRPPCLNARSAVHCQRLSEAPELSAAPHRDPRGPPFPNSGMSLQKVDRVSLGHEEPQGLRHTHATEGKRQGPARVRSRPLPVTGEPARYATLYAQSITPLVISRNAPLGDARRFVEGTQTYADALQLLRTALRSCSANWSTMLTSRLSNLGCPGASLIL